MKNTFTVLTLLLLSTLSLNAQVKQKVLVEHFTNTRCGICASRNPGLFTNLANNPDVLHIATHPSSPYSSCVLYQHNTTENNARTNYYGVLGGTPRIVINGTVMGGGTSFTSSTLFDTFKTKMSPLSIQIAQEKFGTDSIKAIITVKAVAAHSFTTALMYVPLIEDSLAYNAPNGEKLHHNVFRKSFSNGSSSIPAMGDSAVYTYKLDGNAAWNFEHLKAMVIISENTNKQVIQASEYGEPVQNTNSVKNASNIQLNIYPNPAISSVSLISTSAGTAQLFNANGKLVKTVQLKENQSIVIKDLASGIYTVNLKTAIGLVTKKLIKI